MASTVPATITAIIAAFQASPDLATTKVFDGPPVTSSAPDLVSVGYDGENDVAVTVLTDPEGLGSRALERYEVLCAASATNGSDLAAARTRAYALYGACLAALATDQTLGRVVMRAMAGSASLHQSRTSRGAAATVTFSIAVEAFTT